jgi:hypothetical protein
VWLRDELVGATDHLASPLDDGSPLADEQLALSAGSDESRLVEGRIRVAVKTLAARDHGRWRIGGCVALAAIWLS